MIGGVAHFSGRGELRVKGDFTVWPYYFQWKGVAEDALSSPGRSRLVNCNGMDGAALPCGRLGRRWQHEGLSTRRQGEGHRSRSGSEDGGDSNIMAASDGDCHRAWHTHRLLWLSVALVLSPC